MSSQREFALAISYSKKYSPYNQNTLQTFHTGQQKKLSHHLKSYKADAKCENSIFPSLTHSLSLSNLCLIKLMMKLQKSDANNFLMTDEKWLFNGHQVHYFTLKNGDGSEVN